MPESLGPAGCPYDPGNAGVARPIKVQTVTIHRTIGRWAGDYSVGKNRDHNSGTFQYLIGHQPGQWVQFYPANSFCSHAAGSNEVGPGIEISGQNGEPLTDWQIEALGKILRFLSREWKIKGTFTDGDPREWADKQGPLGFITHRHVAYPPAPALHHYDYITEDEFARAYGETTPPPVDPEDEDDMIRFISSAENPTWGIHAQHGPWHWKIDRPAQIDELVAKGLAKPGTISLTAEAWTALKDLDAQ